jgi:predicted metal-binding protein
MTKIEAYEIKPGSIVFTDKTAKWCTLPYPGHPRGCPNYGVKRTCPPKIDRSPYSDFVRSARFFKLVLVKVDLNQQSAKMLGKHPDWSDKKSRCLRYWQPGAKKAISDYIERTCQPGDFVLGSGSGAKVFHKERPSMEAAGINVFQTLKNNGIKFEVKPRNYATLVSLVCSKVKVKVERLVRK